MSYTIFKNMSPSLVEFVEREAWHDLYAAAPPIVQDSFGLRWGDHGGIATLAGPGLPITEFNRAFMVDDTTSAKLADATDWLDEFASNDFAIQIAATSMTAGASGWLNERGFRPFANGWSKLLRELAVPVPQGQEANPRLKIVESEDPTLYSRLVIDSFHLPEETASWFASLVGRVNWKLFIAYVDGDPVGCGAMFIQDKWAWLGIDGTLEIARRQGIQNALIRERARVAQSLGVLYLSAETDRPSEGEKQTSRDNFLRNGFIEGYRRLNFQRLSH